MDLSVQHMRNLEKVNMGHRSSYELELFSLTGEKQYSIKSESVPWSVSRLQQIRQYVLSEGRALTDKLVLEVKISLVGHAWGIEVTEPWRPSPYPQKDTHLLT